MYKGEEKNIIVRVKTTNLTLTPAIEKYAREKIGSLEKFLAHFSEAHSGELLFDIEIGKTTEHHRQGDVYRAEINFTAGDKSFRAEFTTDDLYAAIDGAKDEMKRELRRAKNRHIDLLKRGGARIKEFLREFRI